MAEQPTPEAILAALESQALATEYARKLEDELPDGYVFVLLVSREGESHLSVVSNMDDESAERAMQNGIRTVHAGLELVEENN